MKKTKKKIIEDINTKLLYKLKKCSIREEHKQDLEEFKALYLKTYKDGPQQYVKKYIALSKKYLMFPSFLDEKGIKELEKNFESGKYKENLLPFIYLTPPVNLYHPEPTEYGNLIIEINPNVPREAIHYMLDVLMDRWESKKGLSKKIRFRRESLAALKIWEERRLRKSFKQISKELDIKEPTAKMRFYKAYEVLFGKKYDPTYYEKPAIKKAYLKRECGTCLDREFCKDPCPDVIAFVEQDTKPYIREYLQP